MKEPLASLMSAHIAQTWIKRKNPMYPKDAAKYPARVTDYVVVQVGRKRRVFRVVIQESIFRET